MQIAERAPEEMTDGYIRVGNVCITNGDSSPERIRRAALRPGEENDELFGRACLLGGEVVVASGMCGIGKRSGAEFAVLRTRSN